MNSRERFEMYTAYQDIRPSFLGNKPVRDMETEYNDFSYNSGIKVPTHAYYLDQKQTRAEYWDGTPVVFQLLRTFKRIY
jgi:hypothetical protein